MKYFGRLVILSATISLPFSLLCGASSPFAGRWDLTVVTPKGTHPSWMEFADEGATPAIRIVGRVAHVHPARDVKVNGSQLSFSTMESWFSKDIPVTWKLEVKNRKLAGSQHRSDGVDGQITGVPAPLLDRKPPAAWTDPEPLFNGKDLSGWEVDDPSKTYWSAHDGELRNDKGGANIRTTRKFDDFKLHIEYNCPNEGNSGVYLRGRYEVQVEYEPPGHNPKLRSMGSIYGFLAPSADVPRRPGQWESYDVTFVGRNVTVVRDGVLIIKNQEIPGITGGALDSHEGEPGPLYLQGDHTGGLKYRNITISVPKR
jgi:3-keto-disaccharide hydrolase